MNLELPEQICDAHVHVGEFPQIRCTFMISDLEREMEKYRIDHCLVFSSKVDKHEVTEKIVEASRSNGGLHCLFRSKLQNYLSDDYISYAEGLLSEGDALGIKINPSTERHRVTESVYDKPLALCNDYEALVLIHCGRWVEMAGWNYALEVARKYPKTKFILAHMGGTHPDLAIPAVDNAKALGNVWFDVSQTRQLSVLQYAVEHLGAERILFASDMPWGNYLQNIVGVLQMDLDEWELHSVLRGNFLRLIGE